MIEIKEMHLEKSGIPLWKIIEDLGNKSYSCIEVRCKWTDQLGEHDEYCGDCWYDGETKTLFAGDDDSYSLDDLYDEWGEEYFDLYGEPCLTVWEYGRTED